MIRLASIGVTLVCLTTAPATAETILAPIDGPWTGSGWVKRSVSGAPEAIRCRITASYQRNNRRLALNGKCASPGKAVKVEGYIDELEGGKAYAGVWSNPFGAGATEIRGLRNGEIITFQVRGKDSETKQDISATMIWRLSPDEFTIASSGTVEDTGETANLSEITLKR